MRAALLLLVSVRVLSVPPDSGLWWAQRRWQRAQGPLLPLHQCVEGPVGRKALIQPGYIREASPEEVAPGLSLKKEEWAKAQAFTTFTSSLSRGNRWKPAGGVACSREG